MPSPLPRWTGRVPLSILFPIRAAFPELGAGRRPRLTFSRPARRSLALRPAGSLGRPRRPLSRGFGTTGRPATPLVSFRALSTLARTPPPTWSMIVSRHTPTYALRVRASRRVCRSPGARSSWRVFLPPRTCRSAGFGTGGGKHHLSPRPRAVPMITPLPAGDGAWIDPSFTWQAIGAWKVERTEARDPGGPGRPLAAKRQ